MRRNPRVARRQEEAAQAAQAAQAATVRLHKRFPNLDFSEDSELNDGSIPYNRVYCCISPAGPRLSGRVYPNGSLAIDVDMLSSREFERVMIALWPKPTTKIKAQYVFTMGPHPKPAKAQRRRK